MFQVFFLVDEEDIVWNDETNYNTMNYKKQIKNFFLPFLLYNDQKTYKTSGDKIE